MKLVLGQEQGTIGTVGLGTDRLVTVAGRRLGGAESCTWIPYRIPDSLLAGEAGVVAGGANSSWYLGKNTPSVPEIPA